MIFLLLITSVFAPSDCSIDEIRSSFFQVTTESELTNYLNLCKKSDCKESQYYLAVATMWQAEYTYWPNKKYAYFNEGKKMLEGLINKYPEDPELRFLRYIVQSSCPPFLGYRDNISLDEKFIKDNIDSGNYSEKHTEMILETMNYIKANN